MLVVLATLNKAAAYVDGNIMAQKNPAFSGPWRHMKAGFLYFGYAIYWGAIYEHITRKN